MFSKILIANRGEIACRVIKTARRMGLETVAVYSEADRDALHVEMADETFPVGPAMASQSYLVIDNIIEAAKATGAEAIHPGYGFLSENAEFARSLEQAGLVFIGPNVKAIEVMGDKIESKKFAADAGVNTIPGYLGIIRDADEAEKIAEEIGYPVMIKASAGGGGKGMRIAFSRDDVRQGYASAISEAKSSFGDDRVFLEKYIEDPRHIEIQVLADSHGHVVYLGERECSIQRRNQKVIEEAPSIFIDNKTRKRMGEQSVALARAVDYQSVGTVEFIVDKNHNFYFLEMNTRLQVEHPVTECTTGLDLVEQMIKIAAGEKLSFTQKNIKQSGWAIEARIYAEDPYRNFLPSSGRLVRYQPPAEETRDGLTVRNDTGVYEGTEISIYYDPMIAKLVTHGPDRASAIRLMADALDAFYIDGINHNISFLSALMAHPRWKSGDLTTNFIEDEYPDGFHRRPPEGKELEVICTVAAIVDHLHNQRRRAITQQQIGPRVSFSADRVVKVGEIIIPFLFRELLEEQTVIEFTGEPQFENRIVTVESGWQPGQRIWRGRLNGEQAIVQIRPCLNGYNLSYRGIQIQTFVYTKREAELAGRMLLKESPDSSKFLRCPMPGLIISISVEEGQDVEAGDPLCTVEAMKMENILNAERNCRIKKINVSVGDNLAVDSIIMEFED